MKREMTATLHPLPISGLIVKGPDTVHWSRMVTEKRAGTDDAGDAVGVAGPKKRTLGLLRLRAWNRRWGSSAGHVGFDLGEADVERGRDDSLIDLVWPSYCHILS